MKANADFKVISDVVKRNYNLCVEEVNKYEGYDDLNFKIKTSEIVKGANHDTSEASKREYVLKILNQLNSKNTESVEKQHKVMLFLKEYKFPVTEPIRNVSGHTYSIESLPTQGTDTEAKFLVQLLKYLPGVSMFEAGTPFELLPSVGRLVGKMDRVLKDFQGEVNIADDNLWGLSKLPGISTHIHAHCNNADTELGHEIIRAYKENVYPILDKLQSGVIHNDVNNCNIIVKNGREALQKEPKSLISLSEEDETSDVYVISGIIDFTDICSSVYIYELATVIAEIMASCFHKHNPLKVARQIYKGYTAEFPLLELEISVLKLVLCIRFLQMYVLTGMALLHDPENKYLTLERQEFIDLCRYLWALKDTFFLREVVD